MRKNKDELANNVLSFLNEKMRRQEQEDIFEEMVLYEDADEITAANAQTADDYLFLYEKETHVPTAMKYLKKALLLEPENIEAHQLMAEATARDKMELLQNLEQVIELGKKVMAEEGYDKKDYIGSYWGLHETRPYMRLRSDYIDLLISCAMYRRAIAEGEESIRLNENDNLGIRYQLMHLYVFLEEEEPALNIYRKYGEYEETQMLFPLSILYFKKGDFLKALDYLNRLNQVNKDAKKIIKALQAEALDKHLHLYNPYGYRPFTGEELMTEIMENSFLFKEMGEYYEWAVKKMKKKK